MADSEKKQEELEEKEEKEEEVVNIVEASGKVMAVKAYNGTDIDDLSFNAGDIIIIKRKDGAGWAEGEHETHGISGWFPLECVESVYDSAVGEFGKKSANNALDAFVEQAKNRRTTMIKDESKKAKKRDSLQNLLSSRPMQEDLVKQSILPSTETTDQILAAQKRLLKQQKKKKKSDKNNLSNKILSGAPIEHNFAFALSETDFDNIVISLLQIPLTKHKSSFTTYEDVIPGTNLVQILRNDFIANILKVQTVSPEQAKSLASDLFQRHILVCVDSSSKEFKPKNLYQLSISQTDYSAINLDKIWINDEKIDACEASVSLLKKLIALMKRHLPNFESLRKSPELKRIGLELSQLQHLTTNGFSDKKKLVFFINLFNLMVLYCHSKFIPPLNPLDRRYLYEHCSIITNGNRYSLQDLETEIIKFARNDPLLYFTMSDCTKSTPATFIITEEKLEETRLYAARHFLDHSVSLIEGDYEIHLPKMCQRILKDFNNSKKGLLGFIVPLLAEQHRIDISKLETVGSIDVKFKNYTFEPSYSFEDVV